MNYKEFGKNLKELQKKREFYVLCGDEPYLLDLYSQIIIKNIYPNHTVETLDGKTIEDNALKEALDSEDLFSDSRIIRIDNFTSSKYIEKNLKNLEPDEENVLVLRDSNYDGRKKIIKELKSDKRCLFLDCRKFKTYTDDIDLFIERLCKVEGFKIDSGSKSIIKDTCGQELYSIANELKKLFILNKESQEISVETLESISKLQKVVVFDIIQHLADGDVKKALDKTTRLYRTDSNAEMMISYNLAAFLEKLIIVHENKEVGDLEKLIGIPKFILDKNYLPLTNKIPLEKLKEAYLKLSEFDLKIRESKIPKKLSLERFIIELCEEIHD